MCRARAAFKEIGKLKNGDANADADGDARKPGIWLRILPFPFFIAALLLLFFLFREPLLDVFASPEDVRAWVSSRGVWAPLVFVGIQILQVVVFVIPGEIPQIAGGFLFGVAGGVVLSALGIIIGSVCNYVIGRLLGRPFIHGVVGKEKTEHFLRLIGEGKLLGSFFLLFLIPGIPKDALCYIAGISGIRLLPFMLLSGLGRLPGLVGSAVIGGAAARRNWAFAVVLFSVSIAIFVLGLLFRRSLEEWIRKIMRK